MKITTITSMAMLLVCGMAQAADEGKVLKLTSPDGVNEVTFSKPGRELTYQVRMNGADVILPSRAGLDLDNRVWEMALGKRDLQQPECWTKHGIRCTANAPRCATVTTRPRCICRVMTRANTAST